MTPAARALYAHIAHTYGGCWLPVQGLYVEAERAGVVDGIDAFNAAFGVLLDAGLIARRGASCLVPSVRPTTAAEYALAGAR